MKSKLLQQLRNNQSRGVIDGQRENIEDSSTLTKGHKTLPNPVNPAVDAQARKDLPALLTRNYRPSGS
jgi:hypothetical protein